MLDFFGDIGSFIMTPLYYVISVVLVGLHGCSARSSDPAGGAAWALSIVGLTLVDPGRADPAVRQADQVQPEHAADPAQGQGAAEEVRPRPGAARPGDDEALQGERAPTRSRRACRSCCRCRSSSRCSGCSTNAAKGDGQGRPDRRRRPSSFGNAELFGASRSPTPSSTPTATSRSMIARGDPGARDDGDHVHHPAPADEQEHAGRRADRPVRPAAEDAALRAAGGLRRRRHRVPDRRALLLDHLEPVDDGPAVLRDPQQPGARHAGRRGQAGAGPGQGRASTADDPATADGAPRPEAPSRRASSRGSSPRSSREQQRKQLRRRQAARHPTSDEPERGRSPHERDRADRARDRATEDDRRESEDAETSRRRRRAPTRRRADEDADEEADGRGRAGVDRGAARAGGRHRRRLPRGAARHRRPRRRPGHGRRGRPRRGLDRRRRPAAAGRRATARCWRRCRS